LLWKDDQPVGWRTLPWCPPLSGFSHGAAGICCALFRLYESTKDEAFWEAAREGLAFERGLYDPAKKNWRDLRSSKAGFSVRWCHGAPGVALGRIGALHIINTEEIQDEIHEALESTRAAVLDNLDHVCCGNLGRVEILLYAAQRLGRPDLLEEAYSLTAKVLRRARSKGRFGWTQDPTVDTFDPSFFTGAAGVGYTLLRLAKPDALPCLLLLE
jgi:lantibiotic modifying enzyme